METEIARERNRDCELGVAADRILESWYSFPAFIAHLFGVQADQAFAYMFPSETATPEQQVQAAKAWVRRQCEGR